MKTLLALAICFAVQQIALSQQKETLPPAPSYEGKTLDAWIVLTKDKNEGVRASAAEAIGKIGPEAKTAIFALTELLNDTDAAVRQEAAVVLGRIGPAAKATIPALTELLKDEDLGIRWGTAWALGNMGPDAKAAIPALTELVKDKDESVRRVAAEALEKITSTLPPAPQGKTWTLVWHDEFDGTKLDEAKWEVMPDAPRKGGWWMRKAVTLDGKGHLVISTLKESDRYLDGCVRTKGKFEHSFGYYVARVQLQKQPGHWSAFWMMPSGGLKAGSGGTEIDIYEKPWLDDRVQQTLHWDGYGKDHKSVGNVAKVLGVMDGWHTFGLWWKPDEYIFYVDGKETWRTKKAICQVPEYIKLSDEIGKWAGDIAKANLPDAFLVDYVRVYDVVETSAAVKLAEAQINLLNTALQTYQFAVGEYPTTKQGLQALRTVPPDLVQPIKWDGPYLDKDVPLNPWGKLYNYRSPGVHNPKSFDLWSVGPDGKEIGNWK
jgi:type II secretion system protein G